MFDNQKNKIVYITTSATQAEKNDFSVIDANNSSSPQLLADLEVNTKDLMGLSINGNYAYTVSSDNSNEFIIIDISNSNSPQKVSTLDLSGDADAISVFYKDDFAYVGRKEDAEKEFVVINVSNPNSPYVVSELSGVGGEINSIFVSGSKAYLETKDDNMGVIIVNVANQSSPQIVGSFDVNQDIYSAYFQSEAKTAVGGETAFYMADFTSPSNVVNRGSYSVGSRVRDVALVGDYAFLGTEDPNKEFLVLNISDPTNIVLVGSFNFPQIVTGVAYENNLVYTSVRSNDLLRIITSQ